MSEFDSPINGSVKEKENIGAEYFMPTEDEENQVDNLMTLKDDSKVSACSKNLFARSGIYFENDNVMCLRMLDPELGKFTHELINISKDFALVSEEFRSNVWNFLYTMDRMKQAIDMNEERLMRKRSAILRIGNLLVERKGDLEHEVDEKKKELERLETYIKALRRVRQEKEEIVARLVKK